MRKEIERVRGRKERDEIERVRGRKERYEIYIYHFVLNK